MATKGAIGYKIGKKKRLMNVDNDADLLWQICVREIYVLIKHYGSIELLEKEFENLREAKGKIKKEIIEKCKIHMDKINTVDNNIKWENLLINCQHSYINILDSGYFLNNYNGEKDLQLIFLLDFNRKSVIYYCKDKEYETATIDEIMNFEDMPIKTLTEILHEMREKFDVYYTNYDKIKIEKENINNIINKAINLGGDQNIIQKAKKLLDDLEWEEKKLDMEYRVFYNRLDALNLIDYT
jgi:hypothetical protein